MFPLGKSKHLMLSSLSKITSFTASEYHNGLSTTMNLDSPAKPSNDYAISLDSSVCHQRRNSAC